MNAILSTFVSSLGWALIHFVWQGTLLGMATSVALMLLRNARPQTRYAVSCLALALCLAMPTLGVWDSIRVQAAITDQPFAATSVSHAMNVMNIPGPSTSSFVGGWQARLQGQLSWIVAMWSLGAGMLATRMALGMMWVGRIGRSRSDEGHPRWQRRLDRLAETMGVGFAVGLRVSSDLASPVAAGCWKPMVLIPAALIANMPLDLLEALLAHELAHIKRHDYLVNLIQSAIESLLFYHPVVWWLSKRIRIERELIADDLAARTLGEPRRLALALHELHEFQQKQSHPQPDGFPGAFQLVPAANGGHLMSRIERLIRPNQHALSWKMALPIIGLTAVCLTVYARDSAPGAASAAPFAASTPVAVEASRTTGLVSVSTRTPVAAPARPVAGSVRTIRETPVAGPVQLAHASDSHEESYALVRAGRDGMSMSGDSRDLPQIENAKKKVHGDFIWARHNGTTYVVQDPVLLAKANQAWEPTEVLDKQMQAMDEQMKVPEQKMEALSQQMEELSGGKAQKSAPMEGYEAQIEALGHQQEALGSQMEALADKMEHASDPQRESLQQQMNSLQGKMQPLSAQMQTLGVLISKQAAQLEKQQQPLEQLGKQMEAQSKPMEALGKQMEVLGKQEEQLSRDADRKIRALIEEAIRAGKAIPIENVRTE